VFKTSSGQNEGKFTDLTEGKTNQYGGAKWKAQQNGNKDSDDGLQDQDA